MPVASLVQGDEEEETSEDGADGKRRHDEKGERGKSADEHGKSQDEHGKGQDKGDDD